MEASTQPPTPFERKETHLTVLGIDHVQLAMPAGEEDAARRFLRRPSRLDGGGEAIASRRSRWAMTSTAWSSSSGLQATTSPKATCVRLTSTPTSRTRLEIFSRLDQSA